MRWSRNHEQLDLQERNSFYQCIVQEQFQSTICLLFKESTKSKKEKRTNVRKSIAWSRIESLAKNWIPIEETKS